VRRLLISIIQLEPQNLNSGLRTLTNLDRPDSSLTHTHTHTHTHTFTHTHPTTTHTASRGSRADNITGKTLNGKRVTVRRFSISFPLGHHNLNSGPITSTTLGHPGRTLRGKRVTSVDLPPNTIKFKSSHATELRRRP